MSPNYFKQLVVSCSSVLIDVSLLFHLSVDINTFLLVVVGFDIIAPAGNFLDKLLFGPLNWGKGRMFIALLNWLMHLWLKIALEDTVLGNIPKRAEHLLF